MQKHTVEDARDNLFFIYFFFTIGITLPPPPPGRIVKEVDYSLTGFYYVLLKYCYYTIHILLNRYIYAYINNGPLEKENKIAIRYQWV